MLISGFLIFASEAVKCYYNDAFRVKMYCLIVAILFTVTIQRRVINNSPDGSASLKLVSVLSVLLWTGVGVGGRWIGFS